MNCQVGPTSKRTSLVLYICYIMYITCILNIFHCLYFIFSSHPLTWLCNPPHSGMFIMFAPSLFLMIFFHSLCLPQYELIPVPTLHNCAVKSNGLYSINKQAFTQMLFIISFSVLHGTLRMMNILRVDIVIYPPDPLPIPPHAS